MGSEYVSFAVGKHHVKVLIIDEGLSSTAEDLQGLSIDWIFALGTVSKPGNKTTWRWVLRDGYRWCDDR